WDKTEADVAEIVKVTDAAAERVDEIISEVRQIIEDQYIKSYTAVRVLCGRHKAPPASPGTSQDGIRNFNLTGTRKIAEARQAVRSLAELRDILRYLEADAHAALRDLRPASVREDA